VCFSLSKKIGSSSVSVSESFNSFSASDMDTKVEGFGDAMDKNNSNSNISPRGQDNMFDSDITKRTSFSVDVDPFKPSLDKTFAQSDVDKVFSTDGQQFSSSRDMDSFSTGSDVGQGYGQGFPISESYSQVFTGTSGPGMSYSQAFSSGTETYAQPDMGGSSFAQTNLTNMMQLKSVPQEKSNICTVSDYDCFVKLTVTVHYLFLKEHLYNYVNNINILRIYILWKQ